uniref:beta-N-acetylhexosaminidase n=1 Tax=Ciona savignyi TaxID=51511 RepID=H2Z5P6_CIOSA
VEQGDLNYIGQNLDVKFEVVNNLNGNDANFNAKITLKNAGNTPIKKDTWEIYFYCLYMVEPDHLPNDNGYEVSGLIFRHVNGILFKFSPSESFQAGGVVGVDLVIQYWSVSRTDNMPRWYVASENLNPVLIKSTENIEDFVGDFTTNATYKRYAADRYNPFTGEDRYKRFSSMQSDATPKPVIPTPHEVTMKGGETIIDNSWRISCLEVSLMTECSFISETLGDLVPILQEDEVQTNKLIHVISKVIPVADGLIDSEAYVLDVQRDQIRIEAPGPVAVYYAGQTLGSLAKDNGNKSFTVSILSIKDAPRFEYRGVHIDVARNFVAKTDILDLIKVMGMYKLNNLHFHLTDDEGWRIHMDWCPELTSVGGNRGHDLSESKSLIPQLGSGPHNNTSGSGFYTKEDYKEILRAAERNHIRVIPEVDLPGHAHAAIKANFQYYNRLMNEGTTQAEAEKLLISDLNDQTKYLSVQMFTDNAVNPCIPGTYSFISNVVGEILELHRGIQDLTLFHLGGDEVAEAWKESLKCKEFLDSTAEFPNSVDDLMEHFIIQGTAAARMVGDVGMGIAFWEDGVIGAGGEPYDKSKLSSHDIVTHAWQNIWEWGVGNRAYKLANAGYKVVLSHATHLYFDMPNEPDPEERGLYWASRFTDSFKTFGYMPDSVYDNADFKRNGDPISSKFDWVLITEGACPPLTKPENIIGIQSQIFSETVRTQADLQYMMYPRVIALAERAWHKASWEATTDHAVDTSARDKDWSEYAAAVGKRELARLHKLGIKYRVPLPG